MTLPLIYPVSLTRRQTPANSAQFPKGIKITRRHSGQSATLLNQLPGHRLVNTSTAHRITATVDIFVEDIPKEFWYSPLLRSQKPPSTLSHRRTCVAYTVIAALHREKSK